MTIYVDPLLDHGWVLSGKRTKSCHMFTDQADLTELHQLARRVGCLPAWFQDKSMPHYDLTPYRRQEAIAAGAVPIERRQAVVIWRTRRAAVAAGTRAPKHCPDCVARTYCTRLQACSIALAQA